jgi:hypothetical protein
MTLITIAQTYIQLKKNIENKTDDEVEAYLMMQEFNPEHPERKQLMIQQIGQIRGTVIPYVL